MTDLTPHIIRNAKELEPIYEELGSKQFFERVNWVFKMLLDMPDGGRLNILDTRIVSAENRGLFVKFVCLFMLENCDREYCYNLYTNCTVVHKDKIIQPKPKSKK